MKHSTPLTLFACALSAVASAQPPDPAGDWRIGNLELGFSKLSDGSRNYDSGESGTDNVTVNANGTLQTPEGPARWFFSDDRFFLVADEVIATSLTTNADTFHYSASEVSPIGNGAEFETVRFETAVRLPDSNLLVSDVAGTWDLISFKTISNTSKIDSSVEFNAVDQEVERLELRANGTFDLTPVSTTDPDNQEGAFSGTWSVVGKGIRLSVGGETLDITEVSSGFDTAFEVQTEVFDNSGFFNTDRRLSVFVKRPASLAPEDLVGRWGLSGLTVDVDDETQPFSQDFRGAFYETGIVDLKADGTGILRRLSTNDPSLAPQEFFSWTASGHHFVLTDDEGREITGFVSAQKDFIHSVGVEDGPGGDTDAYDMFSLSRLPSAPGLRAARNTVSVLSATLVRTCIVTENGLFYQAQRSSDLDGWENVGPIVAGDGTQKCVDDNEAPDPKAFYRWVIVPQPD